MPRARLVFLLLDVVGCSHGITPNNNGSSAGTSAGSSAGGASSSGGGVSTCATTSCGANATCSDSVGGAVCTCHAGYGGAPCADVDECAAHTDTCSANATCSNTPGSYTCACNAGFSGDGEGCHLISGSDFVMCEIRSDASLWCWGGIVGSATLLGAPALTPTQVTVSGVTAWRGLSVASDHACAIAQDRAAYCWGVNSFGQLSGNGPSTPSPVAVSGAHQWSQLAAGSNFTCGIDLAGALWCWGSNAKGALGQGTSDASVHATPLQVGSASDWRAVFANSQVCAIEGAGTLWCWGDNQESQAGQVSGAFITSPTVVGSASNWVGGAAGFDTSCVIDDTGAVACFGLTHLFGGQSATPVTAAGITAATQVTAGAAVICATAPAHTWCWGDNFFGELLSSTLSGQNVPHLLPSAWSSLAIGEYAVCAAPENSAPTQCWGAGVAGVWGTGSDGTALAPHHIEDGVSDVTTGDTFTCAVLTTGAAACWGVNTYSQLGLGTTALPFYETPQGVTATDVLSAAIPGWSTIRAGSHHACGIATSGGLLCWGDNTEGQTARAGPSNPAAPGEILVSGAVWGALATGHTHTCANDTAHATTYCFGDPQGAGGSAANLTMPTAVSDGAAHAIDARMLAAGKNFTCAITTTTDQLWCWGANDNAQLGRGNSTPTTAPFTAVQVTDPAVTWYSIATSPGATFICGLSNAAGGGHQLYCWGLGSDVPFANKPAPVGSGSDWVSIAASSSAYCGVKGTQMMCAGENGTGQLGRGNEDFDISLQAVSVPTGFPGWSTDSDAITLGSAHACGRDSTGGLWCWGGNIDGQVGDGNAWRAVAVPVAN